MQPYTAPRHYLSRTWASSMSARFRAYGGDQDLWLADDGLWITV
jgi:hypothetical protein